MNILNFFTRRKPPVVVQTFTTKKSDWQEIHKAKTEQLRSELRAKQIAEADMDHDRFADAVRGALGSGH